ncbi:MAG: phosphate ABC transporter substrate-binding protein [Pelotomaculaceae bacterium]|jgi:phosphate transport system substrate-binding protein
MKISKYVTVVFLLLSFMLVSGCGQQANTTDQATAKDQSIKIGGSSTLAPTVAKIADDFTEKYKTWNKVDASLPEEQIVIFVSTGGSGFGVKAATEGTVDIGMTARDIKDSEKEKMPNGTIYRLGTDALTIAVNPKNPVLQVKPDVTTEEVKKIFAGEISTWKQLDERLPDRPIIVAVRDLGGGASQVFDELVMKGTPIAKEALQIPSMGALAAKVMENADAIGYVSTGMVAQNEGKISVLSVEGIAPTAENISSGKYKIARPLLIFTKEEPKGQLKFFIDYLMSEKGRQVVEEMGFIPAAN